MSQSHAHNVRSLVQVMHRLHRQEISLHGAQTQALTLFKSENEPIDQRLMDLVFPVFARYFFDPACKVQSILADMQMSLSDLLVAHRFIRESTLAKSVFLSNQYPRSLLMRAATKLLEFMRADADYLPNVLAGKLVGPFMVEIHPTNATCPYRCRMCIWCGGEQQKEPIAAMYGATSLLTADEWNQILSEAKGLGTRQIVFSGGGETLQSAAKIQPVLDRANVLGLETVIYTNGRPLRDLDPALVDSILESDWLRVSVHAATPEVYAHLVNRPVERGDLAFVVEGIKRIVTLRNERGSALKIGLGIVLQEANYDQVSGMATLCNDLGVDFLDIRVDCIGVTSKLSPANYEAMLGSLRVLRANADAGQLSFNVSFADDLIIAMDEWGEFPLTQPKRCLIPLIRPAIDPYGIVGACDSIGEPYTRSLSPAEYVLGQVGTSCGFAEIMGHAAGKHLGVRCGFCMPGQISLNALMEKVIHDYTLGIEPSDQAFGWM